MNIIAVDWGKEALKRSAYVSQLASRTISRLPFDGSLVHLLEHASSFEGPVLIGIDAAIGFPISSWRRLRDSSKKRPRTFTDFLLSSSVPAEFFEPITKPKEWSPQRPFIRPPRGRFSLRAFVDASDDGFYRLVDKQLRANPIFLTSGIPGSVGSGTRALWQELIVLKHSSTFRVWPFHGSLPELLRQDDPVFAEIYPKACYGIALAESLPAPLIPISKTKADARHEAIEDLKLSHWLARQHVTITDFESALTNEDDFDALLSATALTRLFIEKAPFESPETTDSVAEGGVLGAASLTGTGKRVVGRDTPKRASGTRSPSDRVLRTYPCPIPGCSHVFRNSRGGWDAHVGAVSRHPQWHPEVVDAEGRKNLFRQEFPEWFR